MSSQDNEKRTPLHAAAYLGDAEIIELLILSGKHVFPALINQCTSAISLQQFIPFTFCFYYPDLCSTYFYTD